MADELTLHWYLSNAYVPVTNQPRLLYLLLEVEAGEQMGTIPVPVNLSIVVDRSESMCIPMLTDAQFEELARMGAVQEVIADGVPVWRFDNVPLGFMDDCPRNLDFVKIALRTALERLTSEDRFALVAFAGEAVTLIRNRSGGKKRDLLKVIEQLDDLELGDDTHMARGMALGFEEAQRGSSPAMVNRMIVLTDGFTLDPERCKELAQQATTAGISVSTMGLGVDFNDELMISIAENSGGNAYFTPDPQEIPVAFAQELQGVQSIALRNLELKMRLSAGVELRKAHRVKPIISDFGHVPIFDRSFNLPLGDLEQEAQVSALLECTVPPRPEGTYRLAQSVLAYDDPARGIGGDKVRQDIVFQYTSNPNLVSQYDPHVMNLVERVSAFKLQTRALEEAAMGNVGRATAKLKAAATRLLVLGEEELAEAASQEAERLEREGTMSPKATKKLRYGTRKLTQKSG